MERYRDGGEVEREREREREREAEMVATSNGGQIGFVNTMGERPRHRTSLTISQGVAYIANHRMASSCTGEAIFINNVIYMMLMHAYS